MLKRKWRNYKTREIQEWEQNIKEDILARIIAFQQRKEEKTSLPFSLKSPYCSYFDFIGRRYRIPYKSLHCLKHIRSIYGSTRSSPISTKWILLVHKKATPPFQIPHLNATHDISINEKMFILVIGAVLMNSYLLQCNSKLSVWITIHFQWLNNKSHPFTIG